MLLLDLRLVGHWSTENVIVVRKTDKIETLSVFIGEW